MLRGMTSREVALGQVGLGVLTHKTDKVPSFQIIITATASSLNGYVCRGWMGELGPTSWDSEGPSRCDAVGGDVE